MVEVLSVTNKIDKNGKRYKYFYLYTPEHKIKTLSKGKWVTHNVPSMKCGYIAYKTNYGPYQLSDPHYNLKVGDIVEGRIVKKKVEPYMIGDTLYDTCKVPVFCDDSDLIEFEVQTVNAFERAGKTLVKGQLNFGDFTSPPKVKEDLGIPNTCLIVQYL